LKEGVTPAVSSEREGEEFPGKKNLTRWSHLSAWKKRKRKRKRKSEEGGCGMRPAGLVRWLLGWSGSRVGPVAAFLFFLSWFFFFLFSVLLQNFCISNPNDFNPKCKIF
jgi:hypothetical protein